MNSEIILLFIITVLVIGALIGNTKCKDTLIIVLTIAIVLCIITSIILIPLFICGVI